MADESSVKPRRLPSAFQYKSVLDDVHDVQSVSIAGGSTPVEIRIGWFLHEDGKPLWFAECRYGDPEYFFMEYGDTRDEVLRRVRNSIKARGIT